MGCCARMDGRPAPGFTHWLLAAVTRQTAAPKCRVQCATELAWAFGQLRLWPGARWVAALVRLLVWRAPCGSRRVADVSPLQVARLLGGLARLPPGASGNGTAEDDLQRAAPGFDTTLGLTGRRDGLGAGQQARQQAVAAAPGAQVAAGQAAGAAGGVQQAPDAPPPASADEEATVPAAERRVRRVHASFVPPRLVHALLARAASTAGTSDTGHLAEAVWAATKLGHPPPSKWLGELVAYAAGPKVHLLGARPALCLLAALAAAPQPIAVPAPPCSSSTPAPSPPLAVPHAKASAAESASAAASAYATALLSRLAERVAVGAGSLDVSKDIPLLAALMSDQLQPPPTPGASCPAHGDQMHHGPRATPAQGSGFRATAASGSGGTSAAQADVSGSAAVAALRQAVQAGLPRIPSLHMAALVAATTDAGYAPSPGWGAAVESASLAPLRNAPSFDGVPSPLRVCLLGAVLFSGHRPSQGWLEAWCSAVAVGARHLAPAQLLAALRLVSVLGAAAPGGSASAAAARSASGGSTASGASQSAAGACSAGAPAGAGEARSAVLRVPPSFLQAVEAAALASCSPALDAIRTAYAMPASPDGSLPTAVATARAEARAAAAQVLEPWGAGKLAVLAAHLHMLGHGVSSQLEAAAQLAVTVHTYGANLAAPAAGGANGSTGVEAGEQREQHLSAELVTALMEVAHLQPRRCGPAASHAVALLLQHVVQGCSPASVLAGIAAAAVAAAPVAALPQRTAPPANSGHALSSGTSRFPHRSGRPTRDLVAALYPALSIGAPGGLNARPLPALSSPGRALCAVMDLMATWGAPPPERWVSGLVSGACRPGATPAATPTPSATPGATAAAADADVAPPGVLTPLSPAHACAVLRSLALMQAAVSQESMERLLALLTPAALRKCSVKQVRWNIDINRMTYRMPC